MKESILVGRGSQLSTIPRRQWERHLASVPEHSATRLGFMSAAHHLVRYFVVRELPGLDKPMEPSFIAQQLQLTLTQVNEILDQLEQHLFFLVRNEAGSVSWAFPITVDETPHQLIFESGEQLYAA